MNFRFVSWVNANLDLRSEYRVAFGREAPYGNLPCPWHQGMTADTPAAKIYGNVLHCFGSCDRNFSVYTFLAKFNPGRLREIAGAGVVPEEDVVVGLRVMPRRFQFRQLSDRPSGIKMGSYEFYEWLTFKE